MRVLQWFLAANTLLVNHDFLPLIHSIDTVCISCRPSIIPFFGGFSIWFGVIALLNNEEISVVFGRIFTNLSQFSLETTST